jgi:glycosyltransferase involved in cell wall biosynthesis
VLQQNKARLALQRTGKPCMKILLSAYACEPGKGSEPAVGWNWALALMRRGHRIHVLTRSNNREAIEATDTFLSSAVTFHYYDLPRWCQRWKHWPGGLYPYYLLWQIGASRRARQLHREIRFDLVHHVTFASFRQPSFMGTLGIPFLFGPVGGGEGTPRLFRVSMPLPARIAEVIRSTENHFVPLDPLMRRTFSSARAILCTTSQTLACVPRRFHNKCRVQLAIGIDPSQISSSERDALSPPHFLFVGRLLAWKGLHLAFRALQLVRAAVPDATLRVIGSGRDESWLKAQAASAGVSDAVEWTAPIPHPEIACAYQQSVALVFPSLHDSGGMVTLEALASGLPVICLDLGGPASIVSPQSGIVVSARNSDEARVVHDLAQAMIRLATDTDLHAQLSAGAIARAHQLTWDRMAEVIYSPLEQELATR